MESKELYRHLPGMTGPWTVERVELGMGRRQVDVYVGHASSTRFACPECARELAVCDHSGEQLLRISWDQAQHLMKRAVVRGRAAKGNALPRQIGVGEKAIAKGHQYMTLVHGIGGHFIANLVRTSHDYKPWPPPRGYRR